MQKRMMTIFLLVVLVLSGLLSLYSMGNLQGNARVINYTGVVRGATQRLVKEELEGRRDDALISKLDGIIEELRTGEGENRLVRLKDDEYQEMVALMQERWEEMKQEIRKVREGADSQRLYNLSEDFFELADESVGTAEQYAERYVRMAQICFAALTLICTAAAILLAVYMRKQEQRRREVEMMENANLEKSRKLSRMTQDLQAPMNEISELLYVSDMDTYELLFINDAGKRSFHLDDIEGKICYRVLQGRDSPCPFCTNRFLKSGENYTWEITNPITGRHYLLKDRLIEWEGRRARLELAFDTTDAEQEKEKLKYALSSEQMVMECVRTLYCKKDMKEAVGDVLREIGTFLKAERTYMFNLREGFLHNDYEWCAENAGSRHEALKDISAAQLEEWRRVLNQKGCIVMKDAEEFMTIFQGSEAIARERNIRNVAISTLEIDDVLMGCLGVDNLPEDRLMNIGSILQTICYFILLAYRRAEDEQQLAHLSYYDTLTSFYNRNRYIEDMQRMTGKEGSVGIVYLDVNGLKDINDRYGHAFGDKILTVCAERMKQVFQEGSFYRVGGDEFVIICHDVPKERFCQRVNELRAAFKRDALCKAAIGSQWTEKLVDVGQVVANADAQMYEDKKEFYRNNPASKRYRHHSDELLYLTDPEILRQEISRNQFVVYLQPKISSADRTAVGAEALIRYQSRDGSLVLPGNFLPLLEESRTVSQIDFFVFEFICSKIKAWSREGKKGFPVSVNFSRYSLTQPHFIEHLLSICDKYRISPTCLEIEITETVRSGNDIDICVLIESLREAGFIVTIDDFGTEYANLALLSAVEFDVLKLDKSMVDDVVSNPKAQAIVSSIVDMGQKMGIQIVAEGIETEEQLEVLRTCGVELAQGFLFSKPISVDEYEKRYLDK